ncbi:helix-turn-helix domain-containing protein [Marinomonas profundi]|uniref:helix-turn-helix domain-containing protein n=1 Tax=Marinomonas profundi TaxID=2726122 RepID=UPI001B3AC0C4|nr:helix-turn-helix domain-containing protein [Marinomonas profundi]UDV04271.1 helix-turn-helix domain-containing protein [Marinomonas profundi]
MSDLKKYLTNRKAIDKDFDDGYDEGYQAFKFGVLLKEARKNAGLTQDELALKCILKKALFLALKTTNNAS